MFSYYDETLELVFHILHLAQIRELFSCCHDVSHPNRFPAIFKLNSGKVSIQIQLNALPELSQWTIQEVSYHNNNNNNAKTTISIKRQEKRGL